MKRTEAAEEPKAEPTRAEDIDLLRRIATHISETLYYNSDHLAKGYSDIISNKFITHDDYDLLRGVAKRLEIEMLETRLKDLRE